MSVYTKTGDSGTTSLIGGERVSKCDPRVEAYGTVDELSAHLALLGDMMNGDGRFGDLTACIDGIQKDLMTLEAILATGGGGEDKIAALPDDAAETLEKQIDRISETLPRVKGFVLPGGHPIVSQSHICRTVCRRAERAVIAIPDGFPGYSGAARYLNRLSDWLYVVGRKVVEILSIKETYWMP